MNKTSVTDKVKIAQRVADELQDGDVVNLGVGIPTLIPDYLGDKSLFLQSENGLLGIGPTPPDDQVDMDLISASKKPITMSPGASLFSSSNSFAMIRGGHVDVAILGALQVDETGEIANWAVPGKDILGVGGAMDLVAGAKKIILSMTHQSKDKKPKIIKKLTFPRSGVRKADMVVTEQAVFKFENETMILTEIAEDFSIDQLKESTEANFVVSPELKTDY
ncbi:3-oxoacid CoA-transferase subunit B [Thalassobacillus cyri]|uniref:3-oxoacid CoA-transferase subunit B n=1 Tax=Thalassobacillus cyri TaxID=571932 RepID=A0A1H4E6V5_9BACI|nr:3-oxoacid CoA-transferase subunit B [Thalassobacillus cyri]SEA80636.1 3-oxoacid CoA-transferase subunit B [Thalassobacillus cyri]